MLSANPFPRIQNKTKPKRWIFPNFYGSLAYRLDAQRHWKLAPCFDLTYREGPGGEHQMDICGEGRHITRSHLMTLAQQGGLDARWAGHRLDAKLAVIDQWATLVESFDIR